MNPARGKWTTTSPTRESLRAIEMRSALSPTSVPVTGTLPVSSGVTLSVWPAFRPLGSPASTLVAAGLAALAISSASAALMSVRLPPPSAFMRCDQATIFGSRSSGLAVGPRRCWMNHTGL